MMLREKNGAARIVFLLLCPAMICVSGRADSDQPLTPRVSTIGPGPNVQYELQARLIEASPGDVLELSAGRYDLRRQLDIVTSNLTIRGAGSDKTILSFKDQQTGGAGIEAVGDNFRLEGLAVEDSAGNAIKILGAVGVSLRDVRAEWTGPAEPSNGAYGLYPVQCQNVLIEDCTCIGASDAGLYVGQCHNVIVRNNRAERNVAGIEIENTVNADVYGNTATNNTGGILVFDLPGLQVKAGKHVRVFKNKIIGNNHPNFAANGNMVAAVPPGTGVMVMATDEVEVFDNDILDHQTSGVAILSFVAMGTKVSDPTFDPFSEAISIHDNRVRNSGYRPGGDFGAMLRPVLGEKFSDILWDGVVDPRNTSGGQATASQIPSIVDNGQASFANFDAGRLIPQAQPDFQVRRDLTAHATRRVPLDPVLLPKPSPATDHDIDAVQVYRSAKQHLSEYGLFVGALADQRPADDVVPYDLNTPLFSDYTTKYRFIRLPADTQIEYREHDVLEFPIGTVIAKTFAYPHDMTDLSEGERLLETRIELRREEGWYGFSYLWNEQQTEATLVLGGGELEVSWIHTDGNKRTNQYQIPNANQCLNCHQSGDAFVPIGPVAANLNRRWELDGQPQNQLEYLKQRQLLSGAPDISKIQTWPAYHDVHDGSVEQRARTWLQVNCAHCHNPSGTARTSGLDLRLSQTEAGKLGIWKTPVAAGHGSGGRSYDLVPGKPDESILLYRIESDDPSITMPNVAKRLVPVEAVTLIRDWIAQMPDASQGTGNRPRVPSQ